MNENKTLPARPIGQTTHLLIGKTCKTPHIEELYFVMSHKYLPILLTHVDLYFIFSHRFSVIIVSHRAHEDAHLIGLIFVSCH